MRLYKGFVPTFALGLAAALAVGVWPHPVSGQEELFVADGTNNAIVVYSRTASGDTAPTRTLSGPATQLLNLNGIFVDTVHNELVAANAAASGSITVYSRTASGNVAPIRILSGPSTGLSAPRS